MIAVVGAGHDRVVITGIDPLAPLHDEFSVGEGELHIVAIARCGPGLGGLPVGRLALAGPTRQPAGVVEVQVCDDGGLDVVDINAGCYDLALDGAPVEAEDVGHLLVELVTRAGFDEVAVHLPRFRVGLDRFEQQAVVHEPDAVFFVRRGAPFPDDAGDDAEHAAAVEEKLAGTKKGPFVSHGQR